MAEDSEFIINFNSIHSLTNNFDKNIIYKQDKKAKKIINDF